MPPSNLSTCKTPMLELDGVLANGRSPDAVMQKTLREALVICRALLAS